MTLAVEKDCVTALRFWPTRPPTLVSTPWSGVKPVTDPPITRAREITPSFWPARAADQPAGGDAGVGERDVVDRAAEADGGEKAGVLEAAVDEEAVDREAVALQRADEVAAFAAADRLEPLGAFVVVPAGGAVRVDVLREGVAVGEVGEGGAGLVRRADALEAVDVGDEVGGGGCAVAAERAQEGCVAALAVLDAEVGRREGGERVGELDPGAGRQGEGADVDRAVGRDRAFGADLQIARRPRQGAGDGDVVGGEGVDLAAGSPGYVGAEGEVGSGGEGEERVLAEGNGAVDVDDAFDGVEEEVGAVAGGDRGGEEGVGAGHAQAAAGAERDRGVDGGGAGGSRS